MHPDPCQAERQSPVSDRRGNRVEDLQVLPAHPGMYVSDASACAHPEALEDAAPAHRAFVAADARRSAALAGFQAPHRLVLCTSVADRSAASQHAAPVVPEARLRQGPASVRPERLPRRRLRGPSSQVPASPSPRLQREARPQRRSPEKWPLRSSPVLVLPPELSAAQPPALPLPAQPAACSQSQAESPQPGPRAVVVERFFAEQVWSPPESQRALPKALASWHAQCPALQPWPLQPKPQPHPQRAAKQPLAEPHLASLKPQRRVAPEAGSWPSPRPVCAPESPSGHRLALKHG